MAPGLRSALAARTIRVDGARTLQHYVEAWLSAGDRLGALEDEAARIARPADPSAAARMQVARNQWIRTVTAFQGLAAYAELDEASDRTLFGPLRDAEGNADRRAARRRSGAAPEPADAPAASDETV